MNTRSLFVGLWGSHTLSLCDCGGNCSSMRSQFYHRPHVFFTEFGNLAYSQFPFTKITLFLHMSICAEPDQCSKKYFPRAQLRVYVLQGRLGSSSKWSICSSRLRTQLKIRAVKVYVLGRLGPSCKSVYVLIDFPQDPAFQYEYTPWGPLSTQLFADKNTVYRAVVPHFHNPTNLVFLCVSLY